MFYVGDVAPLHESDDEDRLSWGDGEDAEQDDLALAALAAG